ncbi:MAG: hypothetical protein H6978_12415 [Gammaproteobacteria bacterium]|nr:hypothetical protein [Gammaproteobacteria bacterium]
MRTSGGCREICLTRNPLLVRALGLPPVVALADSFIHGLLAAVVMASVLVATSLLASTLRAWILGPLRILVAVVVAAVLTTAIQQLLSTLMELPAGFSIYLPLIAMNAFVLDHVLRVGFENDLAVVVVDAVWHAIAVVVVAGALGAIRGFGGLAILQQPAGALLVAGLLAAAWQWFAVRSKMADGQVTVRTGEGS